MVLTPSGKNGGRNMNKAPDKTLGVLGGLGPAASAEFMRLLALYAPARKDQEHPRVILYSDPWIPDRSSAIMGAGKDPGPFIRESLDKLVQWGADILAVPCNSAHFFIDKFRDRLNVPFVHIVESTLDEAQNKSPEGVWLLSTSGTKHSRLYENYASERGYRLLVPDTDEERILQDCIRSIKANDYKSASESMKNIYFQLLGKESLPVMAACTELPLAFNAAALPQEMMISSLSALADACLKKLYEDTVYSAFQNRGA